MPSELKYEEQKVSQNHISALMKFILLSAGGRIQRGDIAEIFMALNDAIVVTTPILAFAAEKKFTTTTSIDGHNRQFQKCLKGLKDEA